MHRLVNAPCIKAPPPSPGFRKRFSCGAGTAAWIPKVLVIFGLSICKQIRKWASSLWVTAQHMKPGLSVSRDEAGPGAPGHSRLVLNFTGVTGTLHCLWRVLDQAHGCHKTSKSWFIQLSNLVKNLRRTRVMFSGPCLWWIYCTGQKATYYQSRTCFWRNKMSCV